MMKTIKLLSISLVVLASQVAMGQQCSPRFSNDTHVSVRAFCTKLDSFYDAVQQELKDNVFTAATTAGDFDGKSINGTLLSVIIESLRPSRAYPNGATPGALILALARTSAINQIVSTLVVSTLAQSRLDKQAAAATNATGTTALVSKAGGAELLAFALDAGALTRSVNGTTATVSGNLEGLGSSLLGVSPICLTEDACKSPWRRATGNIDLSASFALAHQTTQTTTVTQPANGQNPPVGTGINIPSSVGRLSSITAKFTIHNKFDPHSSPFQKDWSLAIGGFANAIDSNAKYLATSAQALLPGAGLTDTYSDNAWKAAQERFVTDALNQRPDRLAADYDAYFTQAIQHARSVDASFDAEVAAIIQATSAFEQLHDTIVDQALGNLLTAQYTYSQPPMQPNTHDFTLVYGYAPRNSTGLLSVNAGVSIYGDSIPSTAKYGRLRLGQVSAEFDRPLTISGSANRATLSLAGYWQYQPSPSVLSITQSNVRPAPRSTRQHRSWWEPPGRCG